MTKTAQATENQEGAKEKEFQDVKPKRCGLVMPISPIDGCSVEHWIEVKNVLEESIKSAGFEVKIVSDADESGIIQRRIITNLYDSDIVVCDVSGKNPNVMFELGIRLAFDKPTVIVKDDKTDYSFDTGIIEHIPYPRDMNYHKILTFRETLKQKVKATYEISQKDPEYSAFLKNFGQFKIAKIEEKSVSSTEYIIESLKELKDELNTLKTIKRDDLKENSASSRFRSVIKHTLKDFLDMNNVSVDDIKRNENLSNKFMNEIGYKTVPNVFNRELDVVAKELNLQTYNDDGLPF